MSAFFGAHNIISPLGFSSLENFEAILSGKSALQKHCFDFSEKPFVCAKIDELQLGQHFSSLGNTAQYTCLEKMCLLSIQDVLKQSGLDLSRADTLLILSTTKGNIDILDKRYPDLPGDRVYLHQLAKTLGTFFHCAHTPLVVSNACISGLLAIIMAERFIQADSYKHIIVCGADLVSEFTLSGFRSFNAISEEICKPFDAKRTGINLGEAAASLLISSEQLSDLRFVAGASANDANHISGPSRTGDGLYQAVKASLEKSDVKQINFISAHGTATEFNDEMEAIAFSRAGLSPIPLNSLKAYYGHTLGTAGVIESIISLLSLEKNTLLRSLGFETPGTSQPLNVIKKTEQRNLKSCLKTASGFGGCNAAAIFEKL